MWLNDYQPKSTTKTRTDKKTANVWIGWQTWPPVAAILTLKAMQNYNGEIIHIIIKQDTSIPRRNNTRIMIYFDRIIFIKLRWLLFYCWVLLGTDADFLATCSRRVFGSNMASAESAVELLFKENSREDFLAASELLLRLASNVLENPQESKYRRIRIANPLLESKLLPVVGGMECLFEMGFLEVCILTVWFWAFESSRDRSVVFTVYQGLFSSPFGIGD